MKWMLAVAIALMAVATCAFGVGMAVFMTGFEVALLLMIMALPVFVTGFGALIVARKS